MGLGISFAQMLGAHVCDFVFVKDQHSTWQVVESVECSLSYGHSNPSMCIV
jgi:hypothetical protein